ncbi:MAG: Rpn family recombination-promoting nuclease/putative transposase, partial [Pseudanabaena sp.]
TILSQTNAPEETLRQVARQIENIADQQLQSNVAASTAIMSGIALSKEIIKRLLRSDIMKESVIYQEILHEGLAEGEARGLAKGKAEGLAKGKAEERNQIAFNMLRSNISVDVVAQLTGLTTKQVQKLQKLPNKKSQKPKK